MSCVEKVVEVRRVSDRVMVIVLAFKDDVLRLNCEYAPQSGGSLDNKLSMMRQDVSGI